MKKRKLMLTIVLANLVLNPVLVLAEDTVGLELRDFSEPENNEKDSENNEKDSENNEKELEKKKSVEATKEDIPINPAVDQQSPPNVSQDNTTNKNEKINIEKLIDLPPQGSPEAHRISELRLFTHSDLIPTGLYTKQGETLTITTQVEGLSVKIGQFGPYSYLNDGKDISITTFKLTKGENKITFDKGIGMIYFSNNSETDNEEVTIRGGYETPVFRINETTQEDFIKQMDQLSDAPFVELIGDYVFGTYQYEIANENTRDKSVNNILEIWDDAFKNQVNTSGLDLNGTGVAKKYFNRIHIATSDTGSGFAYATGRYICFPKASAAAKSLLKDQMDNNWALWHEMGHTFQNVMYRTGPLGEVTNNIPGLIIQDKYGLKGRFEGKKDVMNAMQQFIELEETKDFILPTEDNSLNQWIQLGMFEQLRRAFGNEFYPRLNHNYQILEAIDVAKDEQKYQLLMVMASKTSNRDLSEFFTKWGLYPDEKSLEEMKKYSKPTQPIWENVYNGTIVEQELSKYTFPTAEVKKNDYVIGTPETQIEPTDFLSNVRDFDGNTSSTFNYQWLIKNQNAEKLSLKAIITDNFGNDNKFTIPINFKYGNAISIRGSGSKERAILTVQKESQTIESFSDESNTGVLDSGTGQYIEVTQYDKVLNEKKKVSANKEDTPFEFVQNLKNVPYQEGDFVKVSIASAKRISAYKNSDELLSLAEGTKEEWFRIVDNQLEKVDQLPNATPVEQTVELGGKIQPEDFVKDVTSGFGEQNSEVKIEFVSSTPVMKAGDYTIDVKLTNKLGYTKTIQVTVHATYKNAVSIRGSSNAERAIITIQKESQTIETISDETKKGVIDNGTGPYLEIVQYSKDLVEKKQVAANRQDTPFAFVKELSNLPYDEGDFIKVKLNVGQRMNAFKNGDVLFPLEEGKKEEWFQIVDNQLERVDYFPNATVSEQTIGIGQEIKPEDFIKDLTDSFGKDEVKVEFAAIPNVNQNREIKVKINLTNKLGYKTSFDTILHVVYGNSLSIRAGLASYERAVVRLDKNKKTIESFANPERNGVITGAGTGLAWGITLFDGKTNEVKKEVTANKEDTPFDFAASFSDVAYENGDYIKVYNFKSGYTVNYRDSIQTDELLTMTEYLAIQNDQFFQINTEEPTISSEDTIDYPKNTMIDETQFLKDIDFQTQIGNSVLTDFDPDDLGTVGTIDVKLTAKNPVTQVVKTKIVKVTISETNEAFNFYKRGYWREYGFVLEGEAGIEGTLFPTKESVKKSLEIMDANNQVIDTIPAINTNWYDASNFTGYQVNIPSNKMAALTAGNYRLQVRLIESNGAETTLPIKASIKLFGWTGDYQDDMNHIEPGAALANKVVFNSNNDELGLIISTESVTYNKISSYRNSAQNEIVDGWIAAESIDFNQVHTKELVIESSDGSEIYRKSTPTWNITKTFNIVVKDEWKNSGFQANIPKDKEQIGNKIFIVVKDKESNEICKVQIK